MKANQRLVKIGYRKNINEKVGGASKRSKDMSLLKKGPQDFLRVDGRKLDRR